MLGLDAEAMARLANLLSCSSSEATDQEGTTGSPNPELSLGFTNQEVCQSEKADIIVPNNDTVGYVYDFHKEMSDCLTNAINVATEINIEENGKDDGASGFPKQVQVLSWLPLRPSETPSLQPGEVLIQEKVWTTSGPSTLHHQTLRDLLHGLMVHLALQESPSTTSAPTPSKLEATLLQEVGWILWTQDGINLVLEHQPQSPFFSGTDALEAMLEAAYAKLSLSSNSSTAQLRSARHGEAGAICCLAETIATVICRHAEDWRAPAVSDVTVHFETGCEEKENAQDSAGLEKAGGSSSFRRNVWIDDGSELSDDCSSSHSTSWFCHSSSSSTSDLSSSTSQFSHSSSSSTSDVSSSSHSQTSNSSSISRSSIGLDPCPDRDNLDHLKKAKPSGLQRWFTLVS